MTPNLGVIEGFYGQPWSWDERRDTVDFLAQNGYSLYLYAPKSDPYLRRKWREPMPADLNRELRSLAEHCHQRGVKFGVGFTPYELHFNFRDPAALLALESRIQTFNEIGVDHLSVLFDDMKGGLPGLAKVQADIVHWMRERSRAQAFSMCPTYYSWDPILEKLFEARPENYFEVLGQALDRSIDVFWTGDKICTKTYETDGLERLTQALGRKPLLWDNYPVNDGPNMCPFLHLRAFTGRPASLAGRVTGHIVNPMNQAALSRIPFLSLVESYREGGRYHPEKAFSDAATRLANEEFARMLESDLPHFQDEGFTKLPDEKKAEIQGRYREFVKDAHPWISAASKEVTDWAMGRYQVTRDVFLNQ